MAPKISDEAKSLRRNIIIDHAMKLFSKKGFTETSMDDIVEASGISKGGIYNYFKSKEEIFFAIAEDRFAQRHKLVQSFTDNMSNKEKLIKYIEWTLYGQLKEENKLNARFTFEFWSVLSKNKDTSDKAKERYELFKMDLSDILQSGVENGEFKKDLDISSMVYIILSSMDGMGFFNSVMDIPVNDSIIKNYIDIILKSL
ncbi:TetR/AcrR family transcriptional regulator [Clostridium sp. YIM B02515]|uniref:TetR/AcrR family transcriptional regulator n=1 Tax=Clostridium rhizosphaerae TaxID=2803861 RepID=A0ABS1TE74_9CLOT|nr:TetR/AcrR family transcriptional regulator [Clostridium rhizosphaerae]MBL4937072.1 TetR/AcrR family transcriptional regulator [Clostridium rhizosphaerae]